MGRAAPRYSLRTKLLLPLIAGGALAILGGLWVTYQATLSQLENQLVQRARLLASSLNHSAMVADDPFQLRHVVEEVGRSPEVERIVIVETDPPRIIAASVDGWTGLTLEQLPEIHDRAHLRAALDQPLSAYHFDDDRQEFVVIFQLDPMMSNQQVHVDLGATLATGPSQVPDGDAQAVVAEGHRPAPVGAPESRGLILLALNKSGVWQAIESILWRLFGAVAAGVSATVVIACVLLDVQVLSPLRKLREVIAMQKSGDNAARARAAGDDEIGELTRAFNEMLDTSSEAKARFVDFAASTSDWLWEMDGGLRYSYLSHRYQEVTGLDPARVLGRTPMELLSDDQEACTRLVADLDARRAFRDFQYSDLGPDGKTRYCSISGQPIFDAAGGFKGYRGTGTDITERRAVEAALERLALNDPLTGLANRNLLHRRLQDALDLAQRLNRMVAIMFLDLDKFKDINDTYGHPAGDRLLVEIAKRLKQCLRRVDTVARLGGDEFALVVTNAESIDFINGLAARINRAITEPVSIDDKALATATSIGISLYPIDGADPDELIRKADLALYQAKEAGRGRFHLYDDTLHVAARQQRDLETALRDGLARNEFTLHYQPQLDIVTGCVVGVEALLRWHHPELGPVPPDRFIPIAESSGLIIPIGEWVLRVACAQNKAWQDAGLPHFRVAVNISARQFKGDGLFTAVQAALKDSGLKPRWLELEITEGMVIDDVDQVIDKLRQLQQYGVKLAIDDFGTGYSSLVYLKRLPLHRLKVDQSFVRDLITDPDDAAIAEAVIGLAHTLNLKVIAEGIETAEQAAFLRARGCNEGQGYYFSRPLAADDFLAWFKAREQPEPALAQPA